MQMLWSRMAQARGSCRCPQCLTSASGVARRSTTEASRRAPRYAYSSTLFYSGIFATAATFDAGVKKQRREQWDRAIADARQEVWYSTISPESVPQEAEEQSQLEEPIARVVLDAKQDAVSENSLEEHLQHSQAFTIYKPLDDDVLGDVQARRTRTPWPANTGPPLKPYHLAPQSIYACEELRLRDEARRWTPKKMRMVELSMEIFQLRLGLYIHINGWAQRAAQCVPAPFSNNFTWLPSTFEELKQEKHEEMALLERQQSGADIPERNDEQEPVTGFRVRYEQDSQGAFHTTAASLNSHILHLCRKRLAGGLDDFSLLAKIAYNLAISSAPPNIETYNTLLIGFDKTGHDYLFNCVLRSLRRTHMRSNEITISTIFNHYARTNDQMAFLKWVQIMQGKHGGLALARPDIRINEAGASRLVRKEGAPEKIIQKPYHNPKVFSALIAGLLKFAGFDAVLGVCKEMGSEGWGLDIDGLTPLLADCAKRRDWDSGQAIWEQIMVLRRMEDQQWLRGKRANAKIKLSTFVAMLHLCRACERKGDFDRVAQQASVEDHHPEGPMMERLKQRILHGQREDQYVPLFKFPNEEAVRRRAKQTTKTLHSSSNEASGKDHKTQSLLGDDAALPRQPLTNLPPHDAGCVNPGALRKEPTNQALTVHEAPVDDKLAMDTSDPVPHVSSRLYPSQAAPSRRRQDPPQPPALLPGHLDGTLPASHELADYEARERPVSLNTVA